MTNEEYLEELFSTRDKLSELKKQGLRDMLTGYDVHENHTVQHFSVTVGWSSSFRENEQEIPYHPGLFVHASKAFLPSRSLQVREQDDSRIVFLSFFESESEAEATARYIKELMMPFGGK